MTRQKFKAWCRRQKQLDAGKWHKAADKPEEDSFYVQVQF